MHIFSSEVTGWTDRKVIIDTELDNSGFKKGVI